MFHEIFQAYQKIMTDIQWSPDPYIMRWEHFVVSAADI